MIPLFSQVPPPKCKHCGKDKGRHKANTFNCPWGLSRNFPNFHENQFYEPKVKK